ncbi:diguanylate cyclase [Sphingomonas sp. MM-1]|uniref:putative bifunctional diguanylate cyclase/phosphodiesterase n=1 Tax=Sphingomonas sp. MM-1 TaxID=745310 RepID=UPI0002C120AB|nr:EAL domain-containing protein [Sphingomonas sp. MM-1]AGH50009.1 diguanylate cyclase [Sphingomonas sp. MM-1]
MAKRTNDFLRQFLLPITAVVVLFAATVAVLLVWATREADALSERRQAMMVDTILKDNATRVAHDQEAITLWDEALRGVRADPPDLDWIDGNIGRWLHTYYGHDDIFILDAANRPIYALRGGRRAAPTAFGAIGGEALPLVAALRASLRAPDRGDAVDPATSGYSPGASDITVIDGHPAVVSVKPIVGDQDRAAQAPGSEPLLVSVQHLDGPFLEAMARQYLLDGARFSWALQPVPGQSHAVIRSRRGETVGYLVWNSFAPGSRVMGKVAPVLIVALLAITLIVALLLLHIRRTLTALRASEAHAQHLALHDNLTGLANRTLFRSRMDLALVAVRRGGTPLAMLCLDLDRFKPVNDTLGHPAGDQLLCQVSARLKAVTRDTDTVSRLGGDEFAIIQAHAPTIESVERLCQRIATALNEPFDVDGTMVCVGVSIGVAIAPLHSTDRVDLGRKADIALYEAKARGRGRVVLFEEAMDASVQRRQAIEKDLREAIAAGNQFELYYQPVHDARTRAVIGAEALVRWRHPLLGLMAPATFVPIAEECGLIEPIGEWVLREALAAARDWPLESIAINLSAVQLRNPALVDIVQEAITASGIEPRRVELEITETSFVEDEDICRANVAALRAQGVRIALDDFGTGYSSFTHLRTFAVDRIKVDRSFVAGINRREGGSAIIRAIVGLANARGIAVTAEGVETDGQAEWLAAIGCGTLQGYLMSKPMPARAIGSWFDAGIAA